MMHAQKSPALLLPWSLLAACELSTKNLGDPDLTGGGEASGSAGASSGATGAPEPPDMPPPAPDATTTGQGTTSTTAEPQEPVVSTGAPDTTSATTEARDPATTTADMDATSATTADASSGGAPISCEEILEPLACLAAGCNAIEGFPLKEVEGVWCFEEQVFLGCVEGFLCDDGALAVCQGEAKFAVGCSNLTPDGFESCDWPPGGGPRSACP